MLVIRSTGFWLGLIAFGVLLSQPAPAGLSAAGWQVLAVAALMAIWWISEAVSISVTATLPIILFPLMGLGQIQDAASGMASKAIWLTLGGFILGVALQKWNLHQRIALSTVRMVGTQPSRIIGGFMIATAFLSMWITNTGTTVMMLPIALSVVSLLMEDSSEDQGKDFAIALMLALAYSASIGGMMSLIGTSTNVMFKGFFEQSYDINITFIDWLKIGVPVGVIMLLMTWLMLTKFLYRKLPAAQLSVGEQIKERMENLGKLSAAEWRTLIIFAFTAFLWVSKDILQPVLPLKLNDASIGMFGALLLFITPSAREKGERLLSWQDTKDVPWGILVLLAGGLTLAKYMNDYGVAEWIGNGLVLLRDLPPLVVVLIVTGTILMLSELMSNVATLTAFLPIIASVAVSIGYDPLALAVPATLVASFAFMLPIGTPPNAIVFGSGLLRIGHMVRAGVALNVIGLIVVNVVVALLLSHVFSL
jgi:sodium-dependent dicarboxylate transporter 2/3/5